MKRVTGLGGFFFKSDNPDNLKDWYRRHLDVDCIPGFGWNFQWRGRQNSEETGFTVWGPFPQDTNYFEPSQKPFMFNFRVANLDALLAELREEGVEVSDRIEDHELGRFGWIMDPEGTRVELWEPAEGCG